MRSLVSFILLLCFFCVAVLGEVTDKSTGARFKDSLGGLSCLGCGVRAKGPIKVYSVGIYANKASIKSKLSKLRGKDSNSLKSSKALQDAVSDGPAKLVLKLSRSVGGDFFTSALNKSIAPRMNGKDQEKLVEFKALFTKALGEKKLTPSDELQYDINSGAITSYVNGKNIGTVRSTVLGRAFLNCYMDSNTVSGAAKDSVAKTAHSWLNSN